MKSAIVEQADATPRSRLANQEGFGRLLGKLVIDDAEELSHLGGIQARGSTQQG